MFEHNPDPIGQPSFKPQYPVRLEDLRIIAQQAADANRSAAWGGDADQGGGMGLQLSEDLVPPGFWARITAPVLSLSQCVYSFEEVQDDGTGKAWTTTNAPNIGSFTALEISGNFTVPGDPTNGAIVWMVPLGSYNDDGAPFFKFSYPGAFAWVKVTSGTPSTVILGRQVEDGVVVSGSPTLSSATANFVSADVGSTVSGTDIPGSTTISAVALDGLSCTMSANATGSATDVTVTIESGSVSGYPAVVDAWSNVDGTWSDGGVVWFLGANDEVPVSGTRYQCRLLGTDASGVGIWGTVIDGGGGSGTGIALLDKSGTVVDSACVSLKADASGLFTFTSLSAGHDQLVNHLATLDKTGTPVTSALIAAQADTDGVFTWTALGGGISQIVLTDASTTQRGVCNLSAQFLGSGNKGINGGLQLNGELDFGTGTALPSVLAFSPFIFGGEFNQTGLSDGTDIALHLCCCYDRGDFTPTTGIILGSASGRQRIAFTGSDGTAAAFEADIGSSSGWQTGATGTDELGSVFTSGWCTGIGSGTLPVSKGGTGLTSLTAHDVLVGAGGSNVTLVSPSTAGKVLTSNGTSADPSFQFLTSAVNIVAYGSVSGSNLALTGFVASSGVTSWTAGDAVSVTIPTADITGWLEGVVSASSSIAIDDTTTSTTVTASGHVTVSAGGVVLIQFTGTDSNSNAVSGIIVATLDVSASYSGSAQQILGHDASGNLVWYNVGTC